MIPAQMTSVAIWTVGSSIGELVFLQPWGLIALLAPALLLLLGLSRQASREAFLGTARFFPSAGQDGEGQRRRSIPAWLFAAAAALTLAALALAHPGIRPSPPAGSVLDLVIDRSPSMFHPVSASAPGGPRRIDVALEAFRRWAERLESEDNLPVFVRQPGAELRSWREVVAPSPPDPAVEEPLWPALDSPGTVWITDLAIPQNERKHAGLFASGGDPIPGPIAVGSEGAVLWNADGTVTFQEGQGSAGTIHVGSGIPGLVRDLARLWAEERGVRFTDDPGGAELRLVSRSGDPGGTPVDQRPGPLRVGRDGWEASVAPATAPDDSSSSIADTLIPWLLDGDGRVLVGHGPGEVQIRFAEFVDPPDDPAAFAVSWIELMDRARRSPFAVVSPEERAGAGSLVEAPLDQLAQLPPVAPETSVEGDQAPPSDRLAALFRSLLAGGAAVLGLVAVVLAIRD